MRTRNENLDTVEVKSSEIPIPQEGGAFTSVARRHHVRRRAGIRRVNRRVRDTKTCAKSELWLMHVDTYVNTPQEHPKEWNQFRIP